MSSKSIATASPASRTIPKGIAIEFNCIGLRWDESGKLHVGVSEEYFNRTKDIQTALRGQIKTELKFQKVESQKLSRLIYNSYLETPDESKISSEPSLTSNESSITEIVNDILIRSINFRASDIHIEPNDKELHIRIRVDGKLETLSRLNTIHSAPIVSRLKVLAKMNIVERRRPQDGQIAFNYEDKSVDLRLATVNTIYGEKVVIRILDGSRVVSNVEELGISHTDLRIFHKMINTHFGLVISAGPTGSGKTTTLHSAVRHLNSIERNVTTLEDPVEYIVPGVNHIPVDESIGAGFAIQLRAILRQDPDVVLVGETRDSETARIAIQGALSGRMVLTSLHAPDAIGAIYRLFQMEIEPHLVAASVNGIIAQRLVRRICEFCKVDYQASISERVMLKVTEGKKVTLSKGLGCTFCRGSGYFDRVGLFQLLEITDNLRELISTRPNPRQLFQEARRTNMRTLSESALDLVLSRQTTLEEISFLINSND
jgi:type IV pilus assembly protein PilB